MVKVFAIEREHVIENGKPREEYIVRTEEDEDPVELSHVVMHAIVTYLSDAVGLEHVSEDEYYAFEETVTEFIRFNLRKKAGRCKNSKRRII